MVNIMRNVKKPYSKKKSLYWKVLQKKIERGAISKKEAEESFKRLIDNKDSFLQPAILSFESLPNNLPDN